MTITALKPILCHADGGIAPTKPPAEFAERAQAAVADGFAGLKWDPFGSAYLEISRAVLRLALDNIAAVKAAMGDSIDLLLERKQCCRVPIAAGRMRATISK